MVDTLKRVWHFIWCLWCMCFLLIFITCYTLISWMSLIWKRPRRKQKQPSHTEWHFQFQIWWLLSLPDACCFLEQLNIFPAPDDKRSNLELIGFCLVGCTTQLKCEIMALPVGSSDCLVNLLQTETFRTHCPSVTARSLNHVSNTLKSSLVGHKDGMRGRELALTVFMKQNIWGSDLNLILFFTEQWFQKAGHLNKCICRSSQWKIIWDCKEAEWLQVVDGSFHLKFFKELRGRKMRRFARGFLIKRTCFTSKKLLLKMFQHFIILKSTSRYHSPAPLSTELFSKKWSLNLVYGERIIFEMLLIWLGNNSVKLL